MLQHRACRQKTHNRYQLDAHRNRRAHAARAWNTAPYGHYGPRRSPSPRTRRVFAAPAHQAGWQGAARRGAGKMSISRGMEMGLQVGPGALGRHPLVTSSAAGRLPLSPRSCSGCVPAGGASSSPGQHAYRDPATVSTRLQSGRFARWRVEISYVAGGPSGGRLCPRTPTLALYAGPSAAFRHAEISIRSRDCLLCKASKLRRKRSVFLEAFCFLIIPDFAIFISSEFNLGKNFKASVFFLLSIKIFIFFKAFLYLLFRALFTIV